MKILRAFSIVLLSAGLAAAQEATSVPNKASESGDSGSTYEKSHFDFPERAETRQFDFEINELDHGRKLNMRTITILAQEGKKQEVKSNTRVPVETGGTGGNIQYQYVDIGIHLVMRFSVRDDKSIDVSTHVDFSSSPQAENAKGVQVAPVIRQLQMEGWAVFPVDKPTVLSTVEDVGSGHTFQFVITAKPRS